MDWDTKNAQRYSESFRRLRGIGVECVGKMVRIGLGTDNREILISKPATCGGGRYSDQARPLLGKPTKKYSGGL